MRAAVKDDGTILGLDVRILTDFGAYAYFPANYMARVVGMMIPGAYRLRDYRYAITAVLTNKCPAGPYRAPMLICSWVTEGTVDAVARALGLDPVEVRRRNMLAEADLPYTTATELTYRSVLPARDAGAGARAGSTTRPGGARRPRPARPAGSSGSAWRPTSSRTRTARSSTRRPASPGPATTPRSCGSSRAAPSRPRSAS